MIKRFFRRLTGDGVHIRNHPSLRFFGPILHDHRLWHFHRRNLAPAVAIGLFVAFIPLPMQMVYAAALAILFRANLPVAVSLIWITNPVTIPPLLLLAYQIGAFLIGLPPSTLHVEFTLEWLEQTLQHSWQPLVLGCLILGSCGAALGYAVINALCAIMIRRAWLRRQQRMGAASRKTVASHLATPPHAGDEAL